VQGNVGVGDSTPLIWKLPLGDTGTPAGDVLLRPKGEVDRQLSVANTFVPAGTAPAPLPPPRTNPFPRTVIFPFALTRASRSSITQTGRRVAARELHSDSLSLSLPGL
jgi:hypothetical protein